MKSVRSLGFDLNAFEDLSWWVENDRKKTLLIFMINFNLEMVRVLEKPIFLNEKGYNF